MERLTVKLKDGGYAIANNTGASNIVSAIDRLAAYEDMMERWRLRDIAEAERIFRRVNALGGTDKMAEYKKTIDSIVRCRDCKHMYFKDFEAFCPHRVGPCRPSGFCDRGETISEGGEIEHGNQ